MSGFWSFFIIALTVLNLAAAVWLLMATSKGGGQGGGAVETTGHKWDGDLEEYNNPLPRWWLWLFYLTVVFAAIYLILFPGLGTFAGVLGWSQSGQYERERAAADERYGQFFDQFADLDIPALARNDAAMTAAVNIFGNECAACHGSDGRGAVGFPNLTDGAWLYGGDPEAILYTIKNGRAGLMPPMIDAVGGEQGVANMVEHVRALGGLEHDAAKAEAAQASWAVCAACHGMDGKGNTALGAPNLTDDYWLYGTSRDMIRETIVYGRQNQMPAQLPVLGEDRSRVMAAYVLKLSGQVE
jgi:cytochrome c oxidase cbb3-type subunit 3